MKTHRGGRLRPAFSFFFSCWILAVGIALLALAVAPALAQRTPRKPEPPVKIEIEAQPIEAFDTRDASRHRFGKLHFRGGLVLTSSHKNFGGLSALHLSPDGVSLVAVSDKGRWLTGRILYRKGRPVGIADAVMAPVLGPNGRPLAARGWYDTEAIADDGGTLYVGIERVHRIVRFDFAKYSVRARGTPIYVPSIMRKLSGNKSIEGLIKVPQGMPLAGTLIVFSERALDRQGNIRAFLVRDRRAETFAIKRRDYFDVSDAALLPNGDLLVLERKYSALSGVAIRIRRVPLTAIAPGVTIDGTPIFAADLGFHIDNMEGLAVHRAANGELVLTMISDDNFSVLQRTLLLQFTLVGG